MIFQLQSGYRVLPRDCEAICELAQMADSPALLAALRAFLDAARAIAGPNAPAGIDWAAFNIRVRCDAPRLAGFRAHVCKSLACNTALLNPQWPERRLSSLQVRRILGGIGVVDDDGGGSDDAHGPEPSPPPRGLSDAAERQLDELVRVSAALPQHAEIVNLATAARDLAAAALEVEISVYLVAELDAAARPAGAFSHIVFHWCTSPHCTEPAAVGQCRQSLRNTVRSCGYAEDRVPRFP